MTLNLFSQPASACWLLSHALKYRGNLMASTDRVVMENALETLLLSENSKKSSLAGDFDGVITCLEIPDRKGGTCLRAKYFPANSDLKSINLSQTSDNGIDGYLNILYEIVSQLSQIMIWNEMRLIFLTQKEFSPEDDLDAAQVRKLDLIRERAEEEGIELTLINIAGITTEFNP